MSVHPLFLRCLLAAALGLWIISIPCDRTSAAAAPAQGPVTFNDVPDTHAFYTEISNIAARGITLGCSDGNYCPDQEVTREQMAAFIIRALGMPNPPPPTMQRFADVPPSNIFYPFIDQMALRGITLGCTPDGTHYCPSDAVTREQMAAFLVRAFGL